MSAAVGACIEHRTRLIEQALSSRLPVSDLTGAESLNDAIRYAVLQGGKRMRPLLVLLAAEVCGAEPEAALPEACAIEFLHAASLVIDDLPAMDDARMRRGSPTVHTIFGQDVALLAALALLNETYAIFAGMPALLVTAAREIGVAGMIGGQAADVRGGQGLSRMKKTTALTRLTMAAGAAAAGASQRDVAVLTSFGEAIGEAYQICDDIADVLHTESESGKTTGQDARHRRFSAAAQMGERGARDRAIYLTELGIERLRIRFGNTTQLRMLEFFAQTILARGLNWVKNDPAVTGFSQSDSGRVECDSLAGG